MKYVNIQLFKKHFLFLILIPLVFISQIYLLKPNLKLGLDFTFDEYITQFRQLENSSKNLIDFVITTLQKIRLPWIHEYYYVGVLNYFMGDNWVAYHQIAHFFKSLATLSLYPMFYIISGSRLIAFVSALMFAISYTSTGSLEPLVVNGDYLGIINLSIFLSIYFYLVKKASDSNLLTYIVALFFLILSLFIATTRTFPVVLVILTTEIFKFISNRSTPSFKLILKRVLFFLLPVVFVATLIPQFLVNQIKGIYPWAEKYYINERMHELLLIPFLSFASTILPVRLWPTSTIMVLFLLVIILALLLSKKPLRFISITLSVWGLGLLITNLLWLSSATHNFLEIKLKSPIGFYFLGLSLSFFVEYLKTKNRFYIGLFLGPIVSFTFIFGIWLGTYEKILVFTDIHRYLTHSSIFISFFIGSLIVVLYKKFKESKLLKSIFYFPFLLVPFFLFVSHTEINTFHNDRFSYGFTLQDMDYMRRQVLPYLKDPFYRLIYIDISSDKQMRYFYEQIYQYGPLYWLSWYDNSLYNINFEGSHEKVPHSIFDYDLLKSSVVTKDGVTGIVYFCCSGIFYKTDKFSAVRVIDKKVIDIKEEVVKDLGLSP